MLLCAGLTAGNAFAALIGGEILHFDGGEWRHSGGAPQTITHIWGSGPGNVYAVGKQGTMMHYDGSQWSPITTGVTWDMGEIWGSGPDDIYALQFAYRGIKQASSYIYYDGTSWRQGNAQSNRGLLLGRPIVRCGGSVDGVECEGAISSLTPPLTKTYRCRRG